MNDKYQLYHFHLSHLSPCHTCILYTKKPIMLSRPQWKKIQMSTCIMSAL